MECGLRTNNFTTKHRNWFSECDEVMKEEMLQRLSLEFQQFFPFDEYFVNYSSTKAEKYPRYFGLEMVYSFLDFLKLRSLP